MNKLLSLLMANILVVLGTCSPQANHYKTTVVNHQISSKRCKVLAKIKGKYSAIVITQNCLKAGTTVIAIAIADLTPGGKKRAATESTQLIIKALGYHPKLTLLATLKVRKISIIFLLITGGT